MPNVRNPRKAKHQTAAQKKFKLRRPKKRVVKQLAPIAETKKFCGFYNGAVLEPRSKLLDIASAGTLFIPNSFMWMQRARDLTGDNIDFGFEGNSIFSKYLSMKFNLEYPYGANAPNKPCRPVEMVWGWCNPMLLTTRTTPKEDAVSRADITEHVSDAIGDDFDETNDELEFKTRRKRSYNVIGRKQLMPNQNKQLPAAIAAGSWAGHSAPLHRNVTWKTMKKINLTRSTDDETGDSKVFSYPNEAYIPFIVFYNKDYASYGPTDAEKIKITYNYCHWFNDM